MSWAVAPRRLGLLAVALAMSVIASCTPSHSGPASHRTPAVLPEPVPGNEVLGVKWDDARTERFAGYLAGIASVTYTEVVWCDVEQRPGVWDWKKPDRVVAQATRLGFRVYIKLRVGSCWADGDRGGHARGFKTASAFPDSLSDYANFVSAAVHRYSVHNVHEYAIENEVNAETMWSASMADYVTLVGTAADTIRAADPRGLVVDSGLGSTAYGVGIAKQLLDDGAGTAAVAAYNRFYASRFVRRSGDFPSVTDTAGLQSALQGGTAQRDLQALDAVRRLEASHVVDVHQLHFYESWTALPDLLAFLRRTVPAGMPIQAWEVGRYALDDGVDAQHRAGDVVKLATQLLAGGVSPVIWLPTAVNPTGRHADEPRYGLLDPSGAVRPAGAAFAALAEAARSATIRRVDGDGLEGVAFAGHGRSTLVVWSDTGGRLLPRPRATATAASAAGGTLTWPSWGLVVADQPVLMAVAAPLPKAMRILSSKETP